MALYTEQLLPAVAEGAGIADRDPRAIDRMIEIKISYAETLDEAYENPRFWSPLSLPKEQKHDIADSVEMARAADALSLKQIASGGSSAPMPMRHLPA